MMPIVGWAKRIAWAGEAQKLGFDHDTAHRLAFAKWRWSGRQRAQRVYRLPSVHPPVPFAPGSQAE